MGCNIVQALDAVAGIQSAITCTFDDGKVVPVTHAYPYGDWTIASVNLPFFVNAVSGGPTNFQATPGLQAVDNVVHMYLCLWPTKQGRSRETSLRYVLGWRDAVFAAFAAHIRLGAMPGYLDFVKVAHITHWDHGAYTLGGTEYWALHFELELDESFGLVVGA